MTSAAPTTAAVILAAGEGKRFGGPKAPHEVDGERLVDRAVRLARTAGCDPVVVVLGAWRGAVPQATVIVNEGWHEGMGSSLRVALGHLEQSAAERALVLLVDLPGLTAPALARVLATPADLASATYHGVRGHPVLIGRSRWTDVARVALGDRGARDYLRAHEGELVLVEVGDVASGSDLDQP